MTYRSAGELARFLECALEGDAQVRIRGVAGPERAAAEDLIYLDSPRHQERVLQSAARCVLVSPGVRLPGKTLLLAPRPKLAFARAAAWLSPLLPIAEGVHPTALIAATARLFAGVAVGPFAVIQDNVEIGAGTQVGAFCYLGPGAKLGAACRLHPRVTLYAGTEVGDRVTVHSGAVLGSDGFGYVTDKNRHWKFPQVGALEIADDVEIGANSTLDRGSLGVTSVRDQVKLDNLVHVAHNVEIGERTLIAAQTGVAGSSVIGRDVVVGGQVGIADNCRLEDGCIVGAQAGIPSKKTIRRGQTVWGTPARPLEQFKKQYAWIARLPKLGARLRNLVGDEPPARLEGPGTPQDSGSGTDE
jgi:UDP-3-O-[3-hydroxymyristoyl] glucosamine N-acyltransferase